MADSMTGNIRSRDLTENLKNKNGSVQINKNPGHTAAVLARYLDVQLEEFVDPDKIIVVAGTNDLSYDQQSGNFEAEIIAEKIMNVGRAGARKGLSVVISSLFIRKNHEKNRCTQAVNDILKVKCETEGFEYMDQRNIRVEHLARDGLHLNDNGLSILRRNLLKILNKQTTTVPTKQQHKRPATQLQCHSNDVEGDEVSTSEEESDEEHTTIRKIVPGTRSYGKTVKEGERTVVFSTSITKDIEQQRFNDAYDRGTAEFERFPGKKAKHLKNYIRTHLDEDRPSCVIIQGGGNDLPESTPVAEIADDLLEAAGTCKRFGVNRICIGGVPARLGLQKRCYELNDILERRCKGRNFVFIKNNNISLSHLKNDGVHLGKFGTELMANNYLDVLNVAIVKR